MVIKFNLCLIFLLQSKGLIIILQIDTVHNLQGALDLFGPKMAPRDEIVTFLNSLYEYVGHRYINKATYL